MLAEARYYLRMARFYGDFVRKGPPLDPEDLLRAFAANRDRNFLGLVEHDVFREGAGSAPPAGAISPSEHGNASASATLATSLLSMYFNNIVYLPMYHH